MQYAISSISKINSDEFKRTIFWGYFNVPITPMFGNFFTKRQVPPPNVSSFFYTDECTSCVYRMFAFSINPCFESWMSLVDGCINCALFNAVPNVYLHDWAAEGHATPVHTMTSRHSGVALTSGPEGQSSRSQCRGMDECGLRCLSGRPVPIWLRHHAQHLDMELEAM